MSSNKMSKSDFESKVLDELASIRAMLASGNSSAPVKEKKPRKPRDPDAPPNPWIVFTGKVRNALVNGGKPAGKQAQQFASYLKNEFPDAYGMDSDEILAAHADWTPPPAKAKDEDSEDKPVADESKPKPKRTLSDEQKAKMAAGRKAAAERKKAEKAAAANAGNDAEDVEDAPAPAPVVESKPQPALKALPFKGKKYMWDPENNGMWLQNADGSKGAWVGTLAKDKKSIDNSTSDYSA